MAADGGPEPRIRAVDLDPATQPPGTLASAARVIMSPARAGFVAISMPSGIPAARSGLSPWVHDFGRYNARSMNQWPYGAA